MRAPFRCKVKLRSLVAVLPLQYYLSPASVGKPRAAAVVDALAELNPYVHVSALSGAALEESTVARFHVVVFTHARRSELLRWNHFCRTRSPSIVFLAGDVRGAAGFAFSDFGPAHTVRDPNGEPTRVAIVTEATTDAPGGVTIFTHDGKRHGFDEGDFVVFKEIEGSIGSVLNDGVPRRIASVKANSFVLAAEGGGTEGLEYRGGGIAEGFKVPRTVVHCSLAERVASPCPTQGDGAGAMLTPDLGKFGRSEQLHAAWAGLEAFREAHGGELPALHDAAHADEVAEAARAWAASVTGGQAGAAPGLLAPADVDAAVARGLSLRARAELPGLAAFFGGVIAQEVVKATGKYTPLNQWLYLDAFEALPPPAPPAEFAAAGNRYDNAIALLGRTLQARVADARVFVVGAGALGCEFLKAYALMGVGTGPAGRVVVTDMDRIEVSNLNRQFLFRAWNVGSPKSVTAAAAAAAMNPDFRVEALEVPVGEDTEDTFDDAFWSGLDVVTNALDNLKARQYVDGRCVWYGLPLLESGTLGTKANTQVVVPHVTESYSDSVDPPEESIPMCTLRNFPHAIEHTIEWARDLFAGSFANTVQDAAAFVASPAAWLATAAEETNLHSRRTKLEGVRATLRAAEHADWPMCVRTARELFHAHFYTSIKQLLHNFPPDYADPATGIKFWSGPKRPPTAAIFDPADPVHAAFVVHAAALAAANYGVALPPGYDSPAVLGPINASIVLPDFVPKAVKIKASETDDTVEGADDDRDAVAALTAELSALAASGSVAGAPRLTAAEFEKDDDTNHHIDFVTAAANLRARNYRIKEASRLEVKMTAGKIIPAIATTTCAVTGLVTLEFLKVLQKQVSTARCAMRRHDCLRTATATRLRLAAHIRCSALPLAANRVAAQLVRQSRGERVLHGRARRSEAHEEHPL